eukprot:comp18684_c0_seq1/m.20385 comp18684_c0_seq1/g.20385  ORF comp18684_c0_seq1/g.20385 comp18684_c0_seq1/m.20385 type:complete len:1005 (-) comp18684_c0_seq1:4-3018(-)
MAQTGSPLVGEDPTNKMAESIPLHEVISVLNKSTSLGDDAQEKSRIKSELVGKFDRLDQKLDIIVKENQESFGASVSAFTGLATHVTEAQERVAKVKENILKCKETLRLRKENFIQLWCSSVELTEMLRLLDCVEDVRKVPEQIKVLCAEKQYLIAAKLVSSTMHYLNNDLSKFSALNDLKSQIELQQSTMYDTLVEELHSHIYLKNPMAAPTVKQDEDEKDDKEQDSSGGTTSKTFSTQLMETLVKQNLFTPRLELYVNECIEIAPETNSERFMTMLVESLRTLGKLPAALEVVKQRLHRELSAVTKAARVDVLKKQQTPSRPTGLLGKKGVRKKEKGRLPAMLDLLFERLQDVMARHVFVLDCVRRRKSALAPAAEDIEMPQELSTKALEVYSDTDIWVAIQNEVQEILSDYLAVPAMQSGGGASYGVKKTNMEIDLANILQPRNMALEARDEVRPVRSVFTFAGSDFANSIESKKESVAPGHASLDRTLNLICEPHPRNLPVCYTPVINFCRNMEARLLHVGDQPSGLQQFISDYVTNTYMDFLRSDMLARLKIAADDPDAFARSGSRTQKGTTQSDTDNLIKSVLVVERLLDELQDIHGQLPQYGSSIVDIMADILLRYQAICLDTYKAIMAGNFGDQQGDPDSTKQILSSEWVVEEKIDTLLRQYPTWRALLANKPGLEGLDDGVTPEAKEKTASKIHNEQFAVETELISRRAIRKSNIITHPGSFTVLANMHHSLEWLAGRPRLLETAPRRRMSFAPPTGARLRSSISQGMPKPQQEALIGAYEKFQVLADMCLLNLRMELRCQCYYYLITVLQKSVYELEEEALQPDPNVVQLNDTLCAIEDSVASSLPPIKVEFIFDRLGQLMCQILMCYVNQIKRINDKGVSKMVRNILGLRQNLTNITLSHSADFERAIHFYELLYLSMEEILEQDLEGSKAPVLLLEEYMRIFVVLKQQSAAAAKKYPDLVTRLKKAMVANRKRSSSSALPSTSVEYTTPADA